VLLPLCMAPYQKVPNFLRTMILRPIFALKAFLMLSQFPLSRRARVCSKYFSLKALSMHLLSQGYFIRGAIVKGRLHHDDKMVFGEALVQAYDLETKVVQYPRIMILSDVAADAEKYRLTAFLKQADDGPNFLHVLRDIHDEIDALPPVLHETYYDMKEIIERKFAESIDNPSHFKKVQWFAKYWNESLPPNATSFRVLGPGL
jgi:hypothetical protein